MNTSMNLSDRIMKLKSKINEAELIEAQYKGQLSSTMKILKEEFDCDTLEEAEKKLSVLEDDYNNLEKDLQSLLENIESNIK